MYYYYYYDQLIVANTITHTCIVISQVSHCRTSFRHTGGQQRHQHEAAVEEGAHRQAEGGEAVHQCGGPEGEQVQGSVAVGSCVHHTGHP